MKTRQRLISAIAAGALVLAANPSSVLAAMGGSPQTAPLPVVANVPRLCTVSTTPVNFGNYDSTSATPTDANGAVIIQCTRGTAYTIDLGNGNNFSAGSRRMASGAVLPTEFLTYGLFTNLPGGIPWGTGIAGGTTVLRTAPNTAPFSHTVFGRLNALQDVSVDSYSDTVLVTATF
jgi:spore coat protein U-like protein